MSRDYAKLLSVPGLRLVERADDKPEENDDYITMLPTVDNHRALVVIMHYTAASDNWEQKKCSDALSLRAARALAESWAAATGLEIR